jgi:hypothetical protein
MRQTHYGIRVENQMFAYRNGLIDQMYRTQEVLKAVSDSSVASVLKNWHAHIGQILVGSFDPPIPPPNVNTDDLDQDRVTAMWNIAGVVTTDFDAGGTPDNTRRFMMYIAWHEGARLKYRVQQLSGGATGPARSFFQIQGASAQTAYNSSSMTDDRLNTLASFTGSTHDAIVAGFQTLTSSASYPDDNLIATLLGQSDIFGAYVARALLWTFPVPLPQPPLPPVAQFQSQADYWFQYWHGGVGDADTLKQQFKGDCATIDPLLPPLPT